MLTPRENDFIRYWEQNRERQKKISRQFLVGIPVGLLFVIPIAVNLASGWYKRAAMEANSSDFSPGVLLVALLLIVGFTAVFSKKHQWDIREQRYRELIARRLKEEPLVAQTAAAPENGTAVPEIEPKAAQTEEREPEKKT